MGNPGYVAQTLAKEAVFGTRILESCTPSAHHSLYIIHASSHNQGSDNYKTGLCTQADITGQEPVTRWQAYPFFNVLLTLCPHLEKCFHQTLQAS